MECSWKVKELREKEVEQLVKTGEVGRTAGRGGPPVAFPRKLQLLPTKANLPGPFYGFQMTIPVVCKPTKASNAKSPAILAQHVASLSQKPCSFNRH